MAESWWANRVGDIAVATTTPSYPQPEFGAAYDIGTMPWGSDPVTYDTMRNAVQTHAQDREEQVQERTFWDSLVSGAGKAAGWIGNEIDKLGIGQTLSEEWDIWQEHVPWLTGALEGAAKGAGSGLEWLGENVIEPAERGIKTPFIASSISAVRDPGSGGWGAIFDGDVWDDAWDRSAEQSWGQSVVDTTMVGFGNQTDLIDEEGKPSERLSQMREHDTWYNLTSGSADFMFMWYAAPETLAAKGVGLTSRLARGNVMSLSVGQRQRISHIVTATDDELAEMSVRGPVDQLALHVYRPRVQKLRDRLADGTLTIEQLAQSRAFRDSPNGASMAFLMQQVAKTGDNDLWRDVVRMSLGDRAALMRLEERGTREIGDVVTDLRERQVSITREVDQLQAKMSAYQADIDRSRKFLADKNDKAYGYLRFLTEQKTRDLEALDAKRAERVMEHGSIDKMLEKYDGWERAWAHMDEKFASMSSFVPAGPGALDAGYRARQFATWRPATGNRVAVKAISTARSWFIMRPGVLDLSRADGSWDNVKSHLDQLQTYTRPASRGEDPEADAWESVRQKFLDDMAAATTDTDRLAVAEELETLTFRELARKHKMNEDELKGIIEEWRHQRNSQRDHMLTNTSKRRLKNGRDAWEYRYMDDDGAEVVERLAIDPTELPNYYVLPDVKKLDRTLERYSDMMKPWLRARAARAEHGARDLAISAMEGFNHIWKPLVLLRPAWPVRVFLDEHLRAAAALDSLNYLISAPLGALARGTQNVVGGAWNRVVASYNWHQSRLKAREIDLLDDADTITARASVIDIENVDPHKNIQIGHAVNTRRMWREKKIRYGTNEVLEEPPKEYKRLAASVRGLFGGRGRDKNVREYGVVINPATGTRITGGYSVLPFPEATRRLPGKIKEEALVKAVDDFIDSHRGVLAHRDRFVVVKWDGDDIIISVAHRKATMDDAMDLASRSNADLVIDNSAGWDEIVRDLDDPLDPEYVAEQAGGVAGTILGSEPMYKNPKTEKGKKARRTTQDWVPTTEDNVHQIRQRDNETTDIAANLVSEQDAARIGQQFASGVNINLTYKPRRAGGEKIRFRRPNGEIIEFEGPFAGAVGDTMLSISSSSAGMGRFFGGYGRTVDQLRKEQRRKAMSPGETGYNEEYARILNDHFRNSQFFRRMLDGWTDDQIVHWLKNTKEGREVIRRMPTRGQNPERWVDELRQVFDDYVPEGSALRATLRERNVIPDEAVQLAGTRNLPIVDGVTVEDVLGVSRIGKYWDATIQRLYHLLGSLPTDRLIRNPFFATNYQHKLRELVEQWGDEAIPQARIHQFKKLASEYALKQTRRYLFSLAEESNAIHTLRFAAPFAAAHFESLNRWARIVTDRPEAFVRFYAEGWADLGDLYGFQEINRDGDAVNGGLNPHSENKVLLQFDQWGWLVKHVPGFNEDMVNMATGYEFNKDSLQLVLQSDPWYLPSVGPIVQVPTIPMSQQHPEWYDSGGLKQAIYRYLNPTGVPDSALDAIIPGYMRQTARYFNENEDPRFNNLHLLILKQMEMEWKQAGNKGPLPKSEMKRALEMAKQVQLIAAASSWMSPAGTGGLRFEGQFFVDQWRKYQETYGAEAGIRFYQEFGEDLYMFTQSLSVSKNGVPPTTIGYKQYKKFQDLVDANPDLGAIIVGPAGWDKGAEYNPEVYDYQKRTSLGPGQPGKQREGRAPADAQRDWQAATGWMEYRQVSQAIQAELDARGLVSLNQRGAEDLAEIKRFATREIAQKYPGWNEDFNTIDMNRAYRVIEELRPVAENKRFDGVPHMEGVREYIQLWDAVTQELELRRQAGGSANIEAQSNADLLELFDFAAADIANRNIEFADIYYRYFERFRPTRGIG